LQLLLPGESAVPEQQPAKPARRLPNCRDSYLSGSPLNAVDANWNVVGQRTPNVTITPPTSNAAIADDNAGTTGNLTLAARSGALSVLPSRPPARAP